MLKKEYIKKINDLLNEKVVSVITNEFSELDLVFHYEKKYRVHYIEKSMVWNKFIEWISGIFTNGGFWFNNKPSLFIINTDMITRIPKTKKKTKKKTAKKSKRKKKKSAMSPLKLISMFRFKLNDKIIFFSEKPIKENKIGIKPLIFGNIPDFNDKIWMVSELLYGKDTGKKKLILENCYFENLIDLLFFQGMKHKEFQKQLLRFTKMYYLIRYETNADNLNNIILNTFTGNLDKKTVSYPMFYKKLYGLKNITDRLHLL